MFVPVKYILEKGYEIIDGDVVVVVAKYEIYASPAMKSKLWFPLFLNRTQYGHQI